MTGTVRPSKPKVAPVTVTLPECTARILEVERVLELVVNLPSCQEPRLLNFYNENDSQNIGGDPPGLASERLEWLRRYLTARWNAPIIMVGEAPGYRGARWSGIAFTSQHQLTGAGWKEMSAQIVHGALQKAGLETQVMLWNACAIHPSKTGSPLSNRRPSATEVQMSAILLRRLIVGRRVLAIGKVAEQMTGGEYIRHPSMGGANAFREGIASLAVT